MKKQFNYKMMFIGLIGMIFSIMFVQSCQKEDVDVSFTRNSTSSIPFENYLYDHYYIYRVQIGGVNTYYTQMATLLDFNTHYGNPSPNIFDFTGNGTVGTEDQLFLLAGWDQSYTPTWELEDIIITSQQSSGWGAEVPGWQIAFIKITPFDEEGEDTFLPEKVKSFFIDGVYQGQNPVKVWYHKY
jgi:nitrogen fixation protein